MLFGEAGGRRRAGALVATLASVACALLAPVVAAAETYEVNSVTNEADAVLADEKCETAAAKCTLRAAIEEANSVGGFDAVGFDEELFDGEMSGTITPTVSLPKIVDAISIEGECVIGNGDLRPCVGLDGPGSSEPALIVENAEEVEIHGLAITDAKTGIEVLGSRRFKAFPNWFGVKLDGSAGANLTGILLGPGSDLAKIGNGGFINVFAHNTGVALDILGASGTKVLGNYFGVAPDGVTPATNGKDIEVTADSGGGLAASDTMLGAQLTPQEAATPACDGVCNVISGSGSSGIDLEGDPLEGEAPAAATTIAGNYIGLDASGAAAIPNVGDGVHVGPAARTVIGGPRVSEANRFAGGGTAVSGGPGAANLVVRGNSIGVAADGGSLGAPDAGIVVNSEGLPSPAAEAVIADNQVRMDGGVAISQRGLGGWLVGNEISGADIGIRAFGEAEEHGNLIQDNAIEGSAINGILIESGLNEVFGNEVLGSAGAGIRISGASLSPEFGVSGNLVGGNVEADENLIAASGGAAIEISNPEKATNEVARNWGFANRGLFIDLDLVAASPAEKKGTNEGIEPPVFAVATQSEAAGSGARPEARIRVFRKASAEAGEIESFLGEAVADKKGRWSVAYETLIPGGSIVTATQTSPVGGTSELTAVVPVKPSGGRSGGESKACALASGCDPTSPAPPVPQTKIFKGPKGKKFVGATAAFKFKASVGGSTFQCRLDGKPFRRCHSPQVYTGLKPGKHVFKVRAVNAAGTADPTAAKLKFTVLG